MKVLLTGAFGNIGLSAIEEIIRQGDKVRCFDLKNKRNEKIFKRLKKEYGERIEVFWGDITREEDIEEALKDQDIAVHLAFIIPKLSVTGLESEKVPDIAYKVNVIGTKNLVDAMEKASYPKKIIFTSSLHVFGITQNLVPPRKVDDPLNPPEHYSRHKVECENLIKNSNLTWSIYRLAASLPISVKLDIGMFDVPLENRMEYVHTKDVGLAIAKGVRSEKIWGKVLLIGGGPKCQYYYRDILQRVLESIGVGMLPEEAFSDKFFATDWLDTKESEEILHYQRRTIEDYVEDVKRELGYRIFFIKLFRPTVRFILLKKSPYYKRRLIPLKVLLEGYNKLF
ncbi:MAG TPA: NAD(P)-dependent oxidoreductase [Dictyoglomaceae bacterium]|nr:NAD(P)-dependent oxidoreductase [Dictyoglomaceae bacterium]HPU43931.1 NAD(P)-dependent oxidoreductase [Dictyoglomaceae bacterium]